MAAMPENIVLVPLVSQQSHETTSCTMSEVNNDWGTLSFMIENISFTSVQKWLRSRLPFLPSLLLSTASQVLTSNVTFYLFYFYFYFIYFFVFLGPYLWPMEVPRLGTEQELQLLAYTIATVMPELSHICDLHHSSQQCWILNPLSKSRDRTHVLVDASWAHYH